MTLRGLTVIVARDDAPDDDVSRAIAKAGATVVPLPLMKVVAVDVDVADLATIDAGDVIAFTSRHAVAAVVARHPSRPRGIVAAVGATTAQALTDAGWPVDVVGNGGGAELATLLPLTSSTRVVLPRAADANDDLRAAIVARGAVVEVVVVYRSVAVADAVAVTAALSSSRPLALVLTSPARVSTLVDVGSVPGDIAIVAVGETTAKACRTAGLVVAAVAERPGADPLCAALRTLQTQR